MNVKEICQSIAIAKVKRLFEESYFTLKCVCGGEWKDGQASSVSWRVLCLCTSTIRIRITQTEKIWTLRISPSSRTVFVWNAKTIIHANVPLKSQSEKRALKQTVKCKKLLPLA